jgi:hypothetical protein
LHLPQNHIHIHITSNGLTIVVSKAKVTKLVQLNFAIGPYHDVVECDVVPKQACHILLGRPWQFDKDSMHHGRLNQYSFLHHDKKIVLHPISLEAIMHNDVAAARKKQIS